MLKSKRELDSLDGRSKKDLGGLRKTSEGLKVLFTRKQFCLKLIHNTLWCYCFGSDHDGEKRERGGRGTSGSGRQLVNDQ